MNPFFHKAYDKYLLSITPDLVIVISEELLQNVTDGSFLNYLRELNGRSIFLPDKFFPQRELLEIHYDRFIKQ